MAKADLRAMFPDVDTTCIQAFAAALWNMRAEDWHEHVARVDKATLERELSEAAAMRERLRPFMDEPKQGVERQLRLALCAWLGLNGKPPPAVLVAETNALVGRKYDLEGGADALDPRRT